MFGGVAPAFGRDEPNFLLRHHRPRIRSAAVESLGEVRPVWVCIRCSVCLMPFLLASSCTSALRLHAYVRARTNSAFVPIGAFAQDGCGDGEKGGAGGGAGTLRPPPAFVLAARTILHPACTMGGIAPCPAATAFLLREASKVSGAFRQVRFVAMLVHTPSQHPIFRCMSRPVLRATDKHLRTLHDKLHQPKKTSSAPVEICAEAVLSCDSLGGLAEDSGEARLSKRIKKVQAALNPDEGSGLFPSEDEASSSSGWFRLKELCMRVRCGLRQPHCGIVMDGRRLRISVSIAAMAAGWCGAGVDTPPIRAGTLKRPRT